MSVESTIPPSEELRERLPAGVGEGLSGLYAHQRAGISFLLARRRAILADDMGLARTRQAIIAAREAAPEGPFLRDLPAGVKLNWRREIGLVEPDPDVQICTARTHSTPLDGGPFVNYDVLSRFEDRFARVEWAAVIVDEAHFIKNGSRRASQVLRLVGADRKVIRRPVYLLTGTPR
jgi:SNF2 family DNA or RNA helicase